MSRVDEAMRRSEGHPAVPHVRSDGTGDVAALAQEPFPEEPRVAPEKDSAPERRASLRVLSASEDDAHRNQDSADPSDGRHSNRLFDHVSAAVAERLVIDERMPAGAREQYRRIAAILHDGQTSRGLKVLMVASAVQGEGKTLTAANLALTFSGSYRRRVLLIDADLRRPSIHEVFQLRASSGLSEGLEGPDDAKLVVRQLSPTLSVLPAGRPSHDPMASLISQRMRRLISEARETFDWVILDTPPLVLLPDAPLLASMVDGAILVVRAASTPHDLIKRATEAIGRERIVGVVLNRAPEPAKAGYYGAYESYYLRPQAGR